ncbi:MAG: Riboflavin biosynthesis protein RibF [Cyanobacteria bacterium RYN_339]|nr:Riboflavin biosynthesis protein RibF [Cyanobacteria bacterium RYN_339]
MQVNFLHYPNLTLDREPTPAVIAIGMFDGVHEGHRRVIDAARRMGADLDLPVEAFTFVEHPRTVLRPDSPVPLLTPWPEKLTRLRALGLDACIAAHFTPDLAALAPEEFVDRLLVHQLGVAGVVTGFNFHFGRGQAGNTTILRELGQAHGFPVEVVQAIEQDGGVVSSSRLRELIATGRIEEANQLLGYAYSLTGTVVHGDKRGRTIGFPTANMDVPREKLLPAYGVYACWVQLGDQRLAGVVNIGQRPTFDPPKLMVEAHVFDWNGDIYGQEITVSLVQRIRAEQAFSGIDALIAQITADCLVARKALAQAASAT